jgi:hypothetical protein
LISLRSIIAVTDKQLGERARQALYALAVFPAKPNSFSEEAALSVADCPIEILDLLIDTSLLQVKGAHRYLLHPTIADYACLQLEYNDHFDEAYKRLIAYFTAFVEKHSTDYELLERESSNILAALEAAFTLDGVSELPRLACAFTPFLLSRGQLALAEQHLQRAYETAIFAHDVAGQVYVFTTLENVRQMQGKCNDCLRETFELDGAAPETSVGRTTNREAREALRSQSDR